MPAGTIPARVLSALFCALACYAAYCSARIGFADYIALDHSYETTARALRLAPANPDYYVQLARADPSAAIPNMRRAVSLNPLNSSLWMDFSQIAEEHNQTQLAERNLLRAVALDRTMAPRWLLAEFYARHQDQLHFWPAMRAALAASYDDVTPLFDLCWSQTPDPRTILPRAIPARTDVLRQYLDFLIARNRPDLAAPVAARLLPAAQSPDVPALLNFSTHLLEQSNPALPLEIWNALSRRNLLPGPILNPAQGVSLTNGDFHHPFLQQAFDWRMPASSGIFADRQESPDAVRFEFSGKQPEDCDLLTQFLPLAPSRRYRLSALYQTRGLSGDTGLAFTLSDSGQSLLAGPVLTPTNTSPREVSAVFSTGPLTASGKLSLRYKRSLGTVRIEGSLTLQEVKLRFDP